MQIKNITYRHHKGAPLFFDQLSFDLAPGKIHALHGKNGIGKTVLLHLLTKRVPPQAVLQGEIIGADEAILVDQRFDEMIANQFSFQDNLRFACMNRFPHPLRGLKEPLFSPEFLEKFQIDPWIPAHKLSGGQRQILALTMVLQKKKSVLLLDEPTAALDEQNARLVFEFFLTLAQKNITLLVVCHDRDLAREFTTGKNYLLHQDAAGIRRVEETSMALP